MFNIDEAQEGRPIYVYDAIAGAWRQGVISGIFNDGSLGVAYPGEHGEWLRSGEKDLSLTEPTTSPDYWATFTPVASGDIFVDTLVAEHNRARHDPAAYARELEPLLGQPPWKDGDFDYVQDAMAELNRWRPTPYPLVYSPGLAQAAQEHAYFLASQTAPVKDVHIGQDKSRPLDRARGYLSFRGNISEAVTSGTDALEVVRNLIIDKGQRNADPKAHCPHRRAIFDLSNTFAFRTIGVGHAKRNDGSTLVVINYLGAVWPKPA